MNPLLILLALTTLADHASTVYFIKHNPNLHEGNALLAKIIARFGLAGLFVAKATSFGLIVALDHFYHFPSWMLLGMPRS